MAKGSQGRGLSGNVVKLNARLHEWNDNKRVKGDKISNVVTNIIKKIQEYILLKSIAVVKENVELRTKFSEIQNYTKVLDDISGKISHTSVSSAVEGVQTRQRRDEHAVLISSVEPSMDVEEIKRVIKSSCKSNKDLSLPGDLEMNKNG